MDIFRSPCMGFGSIIAVVRVYCLLSTNLTSLPCLSNFGMDSSSCTDTVPMVEIFRYCIRDMIAVCPRPYLKHSIPAQGKSED